MLLKDGKWDHEHVKTIFLDDETNTGNDNLDYNEETLIYEGVTYTHHLNDDEHKNKVYYTGDRIVGEAKRLMGTWNGNTIEWENGALIFIKN